MTKKKNSDELLLTAQAAALLPTDNTEILDTNIKMTKDDMINIITVGLQESMDVKLEEARELVEKAKQNLDAIKDGIIKQHREAAKKDKILSSTELKKATISINVGNYYNDDTDRCEDMVVVSVTSSHEYLSVKPSLAKEAITLDSGTRQYQYTIPAPKEYTEAVKQIEKAQNNLSLVQMKVNRISKATYVKAQLNLGLFASMKNGEKITKNLADTIAKISEKL